MNQTINLCWLRRDLRLEDNCALYHSLKSGPTLVAFIFDRHILSKLEHPHDRRITFIMESLVELEGILKKHGSSLLLKYGDPKEEILKLIQEYKITSLYFNRDYEPYAKKRDETLKKSLKKRNVHVFDFKDHVFFESDEVTKEDGSIYKMFTPYKKKWLENLSRRDHQIPVYKCQLKNLHPLSDKNSIPLENWYERIHFGPTENIIKGGRREGIKKLGQFQKRMASYDQSRNFLKSDSTSGLSPYLRMGNISVREMISCALKNPDAGAKSWLSELIWREFYQMILDRYPSIEKHSYKEKYEDLKWPGQKKHFDLWCKGKTGFPLIDAAMRCLNETGLMPNRLRMLVANFLCKVLLINYQWGEHYFALKLLDYELASNNGGWQWCAGTGVDAQPYFRIFNPYLQSQKFDPEGAFIKKWCQELSGFHHDLIHAPHEATFDEQKAAQCFIGKDYPAPIVSYTEQTRMAKALFAAL